MWTVNLFSRVLSFPDELRSHLSQVKICAAIPKFHLPAHGSKCWSHFSMNYLQHWGRVDGEAIERLWSTTNPVATSTREMTPGARSDYLEERWGASNFRKIVDLGYSQAKKLRTAVNGRRFHSLELEELTSAFESSTIQLWKTKIDDWNRLPAESPDPYQVLTRGKHDRLL